MNAYTKFWVAIVILTFTVLAVMIPGSQPTRAAGPWYVKPGGNDGNTCLSPATACATINGALAKGGFTAGDTVLVATGTYTGTGSAVLLLNKNATLSGGWNVAFTTQSGMSTINGQGARRGITVNSSVIATVARLVVQNGCLNGSYGNGIYNGGTLTLNNSTVSGNTQSGDTCLATSDGGGIYNTGGLTLNSSTVSGNLGWFGGGVYNSGTATFNNSTLSNNTAIVEGGGIYNLGTLTLNNSTISGNMVTGCTACYGGGIYNESGTVILQNTVLAGNTGGWAGPDCYGTIGSAGHNLIGSTSSCTYIPSSGDLINIDPRLGPLQNNGGSTFTHALLSSSPAINAGNPTGCRDNLGNLLSFDQRGVPRVGRCDIGAYEVSSFATKSVKGTFRPGGLVTYTVSLGPVANLTTVSLTDTLPTEVAYVPNSFSASNGTGVANNGIITWTGTVFSNTATVITFGTTVSNTAQNTVITNTAVSNWGGFTVTSTVTFDTFYHAFLPIVARNYCPDFFDNFSNPASGWPVGEDALVRYEYLNGEYRVLSKQAGYFFFFRSPSCSRENYIVEADARWVGTPGESYGLLFGITSDSSQLFIFDVNTDFRDYELLRLNADGSYTQIVPVTSSSAINPGTTSNHLKVTRNSSQITLAVNGTVLGTWSDSAIMGLTGMGLVSSPYDNNPSSDARFDNFSVTSLPGSSAASHMLSEATEASDLPNARHVIVPAHRGHESKGPSK